MAETVLSSGIRYKSLPSNYIRPISDRPKLDEVISQEIPLIDLGCTDKNRVITQIGEACLTHGSFQVTNHGISEELLGKMMEIAREFFHMPVEEKMKYYSDDPSKKTRLSTSFNVKKEKVHNWRDYLRLHCHPLESTQTAGQVFALTHEADASNVVEGTLSICDKPARVLLDPGATHSYVSSAFASVLGGVGEELPCTLVVSTPVGRSVMCQTYHPRCGVQIGEYLLFADLIVLPMHNFDVILGMDWLARYRAVMNCFEKTVRLSVNDSGDTIDFVGERRPPPPG